MIHKKSFLKRKIDFKKIINVLFFISILLYILVSDYKSIFKPIDIVESENRYANKFEKINFEKFLNGKLQSNSENALADQIIFASKLKSINNFINGVTIKQGINIMMKEEDIKYFSFGGILLYGKDNLVYEQYNLNDYKSSLDKKIESLNKTMKKYSNVDYYFYYIEKDTDISFDDNTKLMAYEYLEKNLNSNNIARFEINSFDEFQKYFYKTDHHWNYSGSYKGYLEVLSLLNIENPKKPIGKKCFHGKFVGSKAVLLGKAYYEKMCAYKFEYNNIKTLVNGIEKEYGHQEEYFSSNIHNLSYGSFYGWDDGEIIFDTIDNKKDNILIIGESFDNAILKLLAEKFNKTISIDLRNYEYYMGKKFDYETYLEKYDIDKVLFIGNINFWVSNEFNVID